MKLEKSQTHELPELKDKQPSAEVELESANQDLVTQLRVEDERLQSTELIKVQTKILELADANPFSVAAENDIPKRRGMLRRMNEVLQRNRLFKTFIVALGLHAPMTPAGRVVLEDALDYVQKIRTEWEKSDMVIHPQSAEERKLILDKSLEDNSRADSAGRQRLESHMRAALVAGESIPLDQMYFQLTQKAGEEPAKIELAQKLADEMVEKFASRMGEKLDDDFVRSVVDEMYGTSANYQWGQGSMTEYFLTGKRNCTAIARAEQVIFEKLIARLPAEKQTAYQLGTSFEKEHEIATLTFLRVNGTIDHTLYLETPVTRIERAKVRTGSPTITLKEVKQAMVTEKPLVIKSPTGDKIQDSPSTDVVTNEPVALKIKIEGKLRGSEYVRIIAEERAIVPIAVEPEGVMEVELMNDVNDLPKEILKSHEDTDTTFQSIWARSPKAKLRANYSSYNIHSPEEVRVLNEFKNQPTSLEEASYGHLGKYSSEVIQEIMKTNAEQVTFEISGKELKHLERILSEIKLSKGIPRMNLNIHDVGPEVSGELGRMLSGSGLEEFGILTAGENSIDPKTFDVVKAILDSSEENRNGIKVLYLDGLILNSENLKYIERHPNVKIHLGFFDYAYYAFTFPNFMDVPNIRPWVNRFFDLAWLENTAASVYELNLGRVSGETAKLMAKPDEIIRRLAKYNKIAEERYGWSNMATQ